jgi:hypothetical protein
MDQPAGERHSRVTAGCDERDGRGLVGDGGAFLLAHAEEAMALDSHADSTSTRTSEGYRLLAPDAASTATPTTPPTRMLPKVVPVKREEAVIVEGW